MTLPAADLASAWADCKRVLPSGWDLQLIFRSTGVCLALATNGATRRWAHGSDEASALRALEAVLLDEIAARIP